MSADIFFILGYIILILVLWLIPFFRNIFLNHKTELFTLSSGYIFLLADIKNGNTNLVFLNKSWDDLNNWLVAVGIILAFVSIILSYFEKLKQESHEKTVTELVSVKKKLEAVKVEYYKLCSDHIREIFHGFFAESEGSGRVSLYKHDGSFFKLLGRYSNNPIYNKIGRDIYPEDEGFIAQGWENEKFEVHGIPKWTKNGSAWRNHIKGLCKIDDEKLRKIKMKSCSFYIHRFNNEDARNPHGIIVLEQLKSDEISSDVILNIFNEHEKQIISLLKSMKSLA